MTALGDCSILPRGVFVPKCSSECLNLMSAEVRGLQLTKGIALVDILQQLHPFVFRISMPAPVRIELVSRLAATEHRLAYGTSDALQLGAVCGAFADAKEGIVAAAT